MTNQTNISLKLAIQKNGRLTEQTISFLKSAGLDFDSYKQSLLSNCRNFPLEILYVRDNDISKYVDSGSFDMGIVGQNMLYEHRTSVKKLLNLRYAFCKLVVAVQKESKIRSVNGLKNKRIATSYPNSTKAFFKKQNIPIEIVEINGSVELAPTIGVADAIVDLSSSGSTLKVNDLRPIETVFESEAVFIVNPSVVKSPQKKQIVDKLMLRFQAVLSAQKYKYVMMNAPEDILPKLKKSIPGLKSPTVSPLAQEGWISVQTVIKEEVFWETVEKLKELGATGIIVLPIEKLIS
jgi:ATP phosphoribosyltransferase